MRFELRGDVEFSLAAAANFGFGPHTGRPYPDDADMRLAFVTDDLRHHAGVYLRQDDRATIHAEADTEVTAEAVEAQVRRILSLDHPGGDWLALGGRDALGRSFVLGGTPEAAFPTPEALLAADDLPGVDPTRRDRLRAVARAALDGDRPGRRRPSRVAHRRPPGPPDQTATAHLAVTPGPTEHAGGAQAPT